MKLILNNGMTLQVAQSKVDVASTKYRLLDATGNEVARSHCKTRVLPSMLKRFLSAKINCIWESDSKLINEYLNSLYAESSTGRAQCSASPVEFKIPYHNQSYMTRSCKRK